MNEPEPSAPERRRRVALGQFGRLALLHAHRGLRSGLAVRAGLSLAGAAVLLACGIWMALGAVADHEFPPYVPGAKGTVISSYSGPWLAGAIGVGALAGLLLVAAVTDLWRRRLIGRHLRAPEPAALP